MIKVISLPLKVDDVRKPKIFHHRYHADYTLMFNVITICKSDKRYFLFGQNIPPNTKNSP